MQNLESKHCVLLEIPFLENRKHVSKVVVEMYLDTMKLKLTKGGENLLPGLSDTSGTAGWLISLKEAVYTPLDKKSLKRLKAVEPPIKIFNSLDDLDNPEINKAIFITTNTKKFGI